MQRTPPRSRRRGCPRSVPAVSSWSKAPSARPGRPSSRQCNFCPRATTYAKPRPHKVDAMLYWLVDLSDKLSVLNVFRYITFRTGGAVITALLFVFLFGQHIIDRLRLLQGKGQPIRC